MPSYQFEKHYTLEEARALLPRLRKLFKVIHTEKTLVEETEETLDREQARSGNDLGGKPVCKLVTSMVTLREKMLEIAALGIQIKDIDRGLIDFPSLREGREVFLCWELEEDDIEFWHDLETGYAGRERL
jgi:hypothetical protein